MEEFLRELNLPDIDKCGNTALHLAVTNKTFTQQTIVEVLDFLIDRGINPEFKNKKGQTVLHLAVAGRMKNVVNCLMKHKVNLDSVAHFFVENEYVTFQDLLAQMNNLDEWHGEILRMETESVYFLEWLISKGIDLDCKSEENRSALNMAIEYNLQHILAVLLKYTKDINLVNEENKTLLHLFLQNNFTSTFFSTKSINKNWYAERYAVNIVRISLERGVSADAEDRYKLTPIQIAIAKKEHVAVIQLLIERCSNIHHRDIYNNTMFQTVIKYFLSANESQSEYYLKVLCSLIANGADVNETYELHKYKYTALCYAVADHNIQLVNFLVENGADFIVTTKDGRNLLHLLAISPVTLKCGDDAEVEPQNLSDSEGWYINAEDNKRNELSYEYLFYDDSAIAHAENVAMIQKLIKHGVQMDYVKTPDYTTAVYVAAVKRGDISLLGILEKSGVDFSVTTMQQVPVSKLVEHDESGPVDFKRYSTEYIHLIGLSAENVEDFSTATKSDENLLHLHTESDDNNTSMKLLNLLITKGCAVNEKDARGNTPLHVAVGHDNEAIVRKLIEHGAEVNCRTHDGTTPLHIALGRKNIRLIELLRENGANFQATTNDGDTLMHLLVKSDENVKVIEIFNLLRSEGCRLNAKDKIGNSPIHLAAEHANAAVMRLLIEHGADVNSRNNRRETPLHFAAKNRKAAQLGKVLLAHGANVHAKDSRGRTALHKAAMESRPGSYKMLWTLLKYGADVNALDAKGLSALSCACFHDHKELIQTECRIYIRNVRSIVLNDDIYEIDIPRRNDSEFFFYLEFPEQEGWHVARINNYLSSSSSEDSSCQITDLVGNEDNRGIHDFSTCFVTHSIKLKAANLPWDHRIDNVRGDSEETKTSYEKYYDGCLREVETLKNTFIDDNRTSLYTLLHMNLNSRRAYIYNEKLQQLVHSPVLAKQFPKYVVLILACYREALMRRSLLKQAREAWLELTDIALPEVCTELIFSFLSNSDLFGIVEKDQDDSSV